MQKRLKRQSETTYRAADNEVPFLFLLVMLFRPPKAGCIFLLLMPGKNNIMLGHDHSLILATQRVKPLTDFPQSPTALLPTPLFPRCPEPPPPLPFHLHLHHHHHYHRLICHLIRQMIRQHLFSYLHRVHVH
jgi:hypothetical protein